MEAYGKKSRETEKSAKRPRKSMLLYSAGDGKVKEEEICNKGRE